jgi:hypothetical protein
MSQSFACVTITVSLSASDVKLLWVDVTGAFAGGAPHVFGYCCFFVMTFTHWPAHKATITHFVDQVLQTAATTEAAAAAASHLEETWSCLMRAFFLAIPLHLMCHLCSCTIRNKSEGQIVGVAATVLHACKPFLRLLFLPFLHRKMQRSWKLQLWLHLNFQHSILL